jgi:AraC-like DNA-binding protein
MMNREKARATQEMKKFIHKNINRKITLKDLSRASWYSPWYASRIFKEETGMSPFEYIRNLRLERAAEKLLESKLKIIDVAFDFMFDSQEGFTRAFTRKFGMPPKKFMTEKPEFKAGSKQILDYYLKLQKGEIVVNNEKTDNTVFVQVVEKTERKVIIKRAIKAENYFEYCNEVGCEIWDILSKIPEALQEPMGMWLPNSLIKPGTSKYVQGVEVPLDYSGNVPEGYEIIILKPCKMMIFQGPTYDDADFEDAIKDLWKIIKDYNPETYGFKWADEDGPRFQFEPQGYRGYIEGRAVREV